MGCGSTTVDVNLTSSFTFRLMAGPKSLKVTRVYLGMLIRSFMILSVTLPVKLKMESLSGLTDLVVSMTKTSGGLRGRSDA